MKKFVIGFMLLGLATHGFAQEENMKESFKGILLTGITVTPVVHNAYLSEVQEGVYSPLVLNLENEVARYDVTRSPIYNGIAKGYKIAFKRPNARILATFDYKGNLQWSFEKFKNIACPEKVRNTLFKEYREWNMTGNTYFVYYGQKGELRKLYKIELENGDKKQTVRLRPEGTHIAMNEFPAFMELVEN